MAKNLINTAFGGMVHAFFQHLAQGNEGSATIEELDLNGTKLTFKVSVRNRQVNRIHGPFHHTITIVVFDETNHLDGTVDLAHPDPESVRFTIDTPVGPIRFSISDLINALDTAGILAA